MRLRPVVAHWEGDLKSSKSSAAWCGTGATMRRKGRESRDSDEPTGTRVRRPCGLRTSMIALDGEVLVHEPYAHGTFSDSRRDALGRVASHITDGEHAGKR